jgi:hypothetical protein
MKSPLIYYTRRQWRPEGGASGSLDAQPSGVIVPGEPDLNPCKGLASSLTRDWILSFGSPRDHGHGSFTRTQMVVLPTGQHFWVESQQTVVPGHG